VTTNFDNLLTEVYAYVAATDIFVKGDQKLTRMQKLMDFLGNPEKKLKLLHVAGTSGKTSTSYFAAALLREAGLKVGLTVSPHVTDVRERAQIALQVLPKNIYVKELSKYLQLLQTGGLKPSYMEFFMGFFYYLAAKM
jgi:dihydrofolate synthase/folylpolyglutamate synthase